MVDLSKHLARSRTAISGRNYDLAIEICLECQEVDPTNCENYEMLIEASVRRAKENGKKGFGMSLKLSRDPHKLLTQSVKTVTKNPDLKAFMAAGDAARAVFDSGVKKMVDVSILFYEQGRAGGLFNGNLLWFLAHMYMEKFKVRNTPEAIENAISRMAELERGDKKHKDAPRLVKSWEALRSTVSRSKDNKDADDYKTQLADDEDARRNELRNRLIRTQEDADAVLEMLDGELEKDPKNKSDLLKKGDVLRRVKKFTEAREIYEYAQALDEHDFTIVIRLGDMGIDERENKIRQLEKAGKDSAVAKEELLEFQIATMRVRVEKQPTELRHKYNLGVFLFKHGDVDEAAGMFQAAVNDPQSKRDSHNYLGQCFVKKKLYDMAITQFTHNLTMQVDEHSKGAKSVLYNRARIFEVTKKLEEAKADYTHLVEMDLSFKDCADRLAAVSEKLL